MTENLPGESPRTGPEPVNPSTVLHGTHQLVAVLPHLLGYRPDHSLVLITTTAVGSPGGRPARAEVGFTARVDLPPPGLYGAVLDQLRPALCRAAERAEGPMLLHLLGYDVPTGEGADAELVGAGVRVADRLGCGLHEVVLVRGRRCRWLYADASPLPGPQGWEDLPDPAWVPGTADLVLAGRVPLASRQAVADRVRWRDEEAAAATEVALRLVLAQAPGPAEVATLVTEALQALGAWAVHGAPAPNARLRARIVLALADTAVRDEVLLRWAPRLFPSAEEPGSAGSVPAWPGSHAAGVDRLLTLAGQVPAGDGAPLLTVAALLAWSSGEGTVANEACTLALETDPGYRMAVLLRQALDLGLPPWPTHTSRRVA
jgi:hypothetical protein